jgi:hypothetical protein
MNIKPKVRNTALAVALAAVTASAWATHEALSDTAYVPAPSAAVEPAPLTATEPIALNDSLTADESVVAASDATVVAPVADASIPQPAITIEQRRLSEDERIQAVVMEKLANNPRLSGKIGVESYDSVVTLTGYTSTVGQATRAGYDARSVIGVKYVQNQIRPRVGGSV